MNSRLHTALNDCIRLTSRLNDQVRESEDNIYFCAGGELRQAYLENCELAERRIAEMKNSLQGLYAEIDYFERQQALL